MGGHWGSTELYPNMWNMRGHLYPNKKLGKMG